MLHPHVPEELKHFGKHLLATFLGLLMALGLESWHQAHQHAKTAASARAFLARDLEANRAELRKEIDSIRAQAPRLLPFIQALEAQVGERAPVAPPAFSKEAFSMDLATLRAASWEAAMATQAFAYMEPWRVEKIASAFEIQRDLQDTHRQLVQRLFPLAHLTPLVTGQKPLGAIPKPQAQAMLNDVRAALIAIQMTYDSAKKLDTASEEAIKACR